MLKPGLIPAKVTKFSGRVEIARNFDWKWVKVVDNLLVQEGDWIRTRAKSSVEIKQDDGTIIVLRPNTKILFESNGQAKTARGEVRTTKLKLDQKVEPLRRPRLEVNNINRGRVDFGDTEQHVSVDVPHARPGMIAVIQTFASSLRWNPHIHPITSRGVWTPDGEWMPVAYVDEHRAKLLFRHKLLTLLRHRGLISQDRIDLLLSWRHSGM